MMASEVPTAMVRPRPRPSAGTLPQPRRARRTVSGWSVIGATLAHDDRLAIVVAPERDLDRV